MITLNKILAAILLTVLAAAAKLAGVFPFSWFWVLAPLWMFVPALIAVALFGALVVNEMRRQ